jgi:hypothetical protein
MANIASGNPTAGLPGIPGGLGGGLPGGLGGGLPGGVGRIPGVPGL